MFNPFKTRLACDHSITSEEREKFLDFVKGQLQIIGCDRTWREGPKVHFSNNLLSLSRGRYHVMAGVDSGVVAFSPFSNQIEYEYRNMRVGVFMLVILGIALLGLSLGAEVPTFLPFVFVFMMAFAVTINWAVVRHRQQKLLRQLESEYQQMKTVFSMPRQ